MVQVMASERKARMEVDDLRQQLQSRGQDAERKRRGPDEETLRKIRRLEDTIAELQKNLSAQKQVGTVHGSSRRICSESVKEIYAEYVQIITDYNEPFHTFHVSYICLICVMHSCCTVAKFLIFACLRCDCSAKL